MGRSPAADPWPLSSCSWGSKYRVTEEALLVPESSRRMFATSPFQHLPPHNRETDKPRIVLQSYSESPASMWNRNAYVPPTPPPSPPPPPLPPYPSPPPSQPISGWATKHPLADLFRPFFYHPASPRPPPFLYPVPGPPHPAASAPIPPSSYSSHSLLSGSCPPISPSCTSPGPSSCATTTATTDACSAPPSSPSDTGDKVHAGGAGQETDSRSRLGPAAGSGHVVGHSPQLHRHCDATTRAGASAVRSKGGSSRRSEYRDGHGKAISPSAAEANDELREDLDGAGEVPPIRTATL